MAAPGDTLWLGIDAGGSRSAARLVDDAGHVLGTATGGPASGRLGPETLIAAIRGLAREALGPHEPGRVIAGLGVAGLTRPGIAPALDANPFGFGQLALASDATIAALGALGGGDGGVISLGTGTIAVLHQTGTETLIDGYGFPVSDTGSGAWIGLEAVRASLAGLDGLAASGALCEAVLDRIGRDRIAISAWQTGATATDFAAFAPLVFAAHDAGDPAASMILTRAGTHTATLIGALGARGAQRISLVGGLAAHLQPWIPLGARSRLVEPLVDAVDGAILLARAKR